MIITTKEGYLRERLMGHLTFVATMGIESLTNQPYILSKKEHCLHSLVTAQALSDNGNMTLPTACSFDIQAIDTAIQCENPSELFETLLYIRIGEKEYLRTKLFGEDVGKNKPVYLSHYEFKHRPDGTCDCLRINPLQYFSIGLLNPPSLFKIQTSLIGDLYRPVP